MKSSNNKRNRKYLYENPNGNTEMIEYLKTIDCKYHIIGHYTNSEYKEKDNIIICGFIYFANACWLSSVKSLLKMEHVKMTTKYPEELADKYRKISNSWEYGILPVQGKRISKRASDGMIPYANDEMPITNMIVEQNNTLLAQNNEMCQYLMKQNQQLIDENIRLKDIAITTTNITNHIGTKIENKVFNINVFLNEECKHAVTLVDFVNSLQVEDSDLEYARDRGFVEAVTQIFERGLKQYDVETRPLHCTDIKRETMHIKDNDGWVKETGGDSKHIKTAINTISRKKISKFCEFMKKHPELDDIKSPGYEGGIQMMKNVMGGSLNYAEMNEKKVMKNLAKSVYMHP